MQIRFWMLQSGWGEVVQSVASPSLSRTHCFNYTLVQRDAPLSLLFLLGKKKHLRAEGEDLLCFWAAQTAASFARRTVANSPPSCALSWRARSRNTGMRIHAPRRTPMFSSSLLSHMCKCHQRKNYNFRWGGGICLRRTPRLTIPTEQRISAYFVFG